MTKKVLLKNSRRYSRIRQGSLIEGCRGARLVGRSLADCKRGLPVETSPHVLKVLGLVIRHGLLHPVVEMMMEETISIACSKVLVRSRLQGVVVSL